MGGGGLVIRTCQSRGGKQSTNSSRKRGGVKGMKGVPVARNNARGKGAGLCLYTSTEHASEAFSGIVGNREGRITTFSCNDPSM